MQQRESLAYLTEYLDANISDIAEAMLYDVAAVAGDAATVGRIVRESGQRAEAFEAMREALRYLRPRIDAVRRAHLQCADKAANTDGQRHKESNFRDQAAGEAMMLDTLDAALALADKVSR